MAELGEGGRGSSFSRGSRSAAFSSRSADVDLGTASKIIRAGDEVKAKAEAHHDRHREGWTAKRYGELLGKAGNAPALTPLGLSSDPKAALMAKARAGVAHKQASRIERVERAQANMLQTGRVRDGRTVHWGRGLGE